METIDIGVLEHRIKTSRRRAQLQGLVNAIRSAPPNTVNRLVAQIRKPRGETNEVAIAVGPLNELEGGCPSHPGGVQTIDLGAKRCHVPQQNMALSFFVGPIHTIAMTILSIRKTRYFRSLAVIAIVGLHQKRAMTQAMIR